MNPSHKHITVGSKKLLVFLNGMENTGTSSNSFSAYKTIITNFNDYDILFIKDIKKGYWYLTAIPYISDLIQYLITYYNYTSLFGFTYSSGTICLLNLLHKYDIFKKAVIINGQVSLNQYVVSKYSTDSGCAIFRKNIIKEKYDDNYLEPLKNIPNNMLAKYIFYYNKTISDGVNHSHLIKYFYIGDEFKDNIFFNHSTISHKNYIKELLCNTKFLIKIKNQFDSLA